MREKPKRKKPRLDVVLPPDLEQEFKDEVFRRFGMKKGNLSKAIEEAIRLWIKEQRKRQRGPLTKK